MSGFHREGGRLLCDGVSLEEAAARHGTPLYVYSRRAVEDAYRAYAEAFAKLWRCAFCAGVHSIPLISGAG